MPSRLSIGLPGRKIGQANRDLVAKPAKITSQLSAQLSIIPRALSHQSSRGPSALRVQFSSKATSAPPPITKRVAGGRASPMWPIHGAQGGHTAGHGDVSGGTCGANEPCGKG